MRRARSEDQKQTRREELLNRAKELFSASSFESVTMADVALKAGVAKGTLFLYFKSKEELFLEVLEQLLEEWFTEIDSMLPATNSVDDVSRLLCQSLENRAILTRLLAILHTTLETNLAFDRLVSFKLFLRDHLLATGNLLEQRLQFLKPGEGAVLLLQIDALIIGLGHLSNPGEIALKVLEKPELATLKVDFSLQLSHTLKVFLRGLEAEAKG
ncbi:MAG: TetR family transcriptional regulator [Chloroflexi bacterium]|uniref:TetR family transcriptional regulator n=1 Tax=Candidatus Chlorohelix allophototropha TaxID=3003348 RepID=A0A8T7LUA1_9CHLR|nr:TetR family transcriptional regulator [Chloroflexota bacterium]WJW66309.1 TetR family transcriptional regulator [Chloroflexota bacterium L227-S17]